MDAEISPSGLIEELDALVESGDFEGGEEVLARALAGAAGSMAAFYHFQYGRLYTRWGKLSSAIAHFHQAIDHSTDALFTMTVAQELRVVRERQMAERP